MQQLTAKHSNAQIGYLDLAQQPTPHLTAEILMGQDAEQAALGEKIIQQYIDADVVVVGAAMYNFGLTLTLKAWIDRISVAVGIVDNNLADLQEDFLKTIFNFTGVNDVEIIRAEGVSMPEFKDQAVANAMQKIQAI